jgi:hypothetical protein
VFSSNAALLATLAASFASPSPPASVQADEQSSSAAQPDWLEWETRKQERLRKNRLDQRIA